MIVITSMVALGFLLGMRHATDPDHVIAVTTIVSQQRSLRHAAMAGVFRGLGRTIAILIVGSPIILFKFVILPKAGPTMELSVGLMLILLGILNLAGFMSWIGGRRLAPAYNHSGTIWGGDVVPGLSVGSGRSVAGGLENHLEVLARDVIVLHECEVGHSALDGVHQGVVSTRLLNFSVSNTLIPMTNTFA